MTDAQRSEIHQKITAMLSEINDLSFKFGGTPVQLELEQAYRHLNRGAIALNRVAIEDEMVVARQSSSNSAIA